MRSLLLLLLIPAALPAQAVQTISPQRCVWRAGDNPAWAAPSLDESGWLPWQDWKPDFAQARLWVRCHANLAPLRTEPHPAIQISLYSAYQLFLDGVPIGAEGNLHDGNSSLDAIRSYPVPMRLLNPGTATIALRMTNRITLSNSGPFRGIVGAPLEMRAGSQSLLGAIRAHTVLAQAAQFVPTAIGFGIIGVLAAVLLGLFIYDRSRHELLLLSVACLTLAMLRINELAAASLFNYSVSAGLVILGLGNIGLTVTEVPFFYALARRRVPWLIVALLAATAAAYFPTWVDAYAAANQPPWMGPLNSDFVRPFALISHFAVSFVPFFVFGSWRAIPRRMRPLAILCMLWGAADVVWFAVEMTGMPIPGVPNLFARWGLTLLAARAFTTAGVLAALLGLLFREQRQVTEERATLAGEMLAAQQVQRMLAPAALDVLPGVRIKVAFRPIREVGGDFYGCARLPENRQRILIGDVSGKGAAAAMTAAVLVGAARRRENEAPGALLEHLNLVLGDMNLGGFATCLCADLSASGCLTLANAGHLAPYRSGQEVPVESGLPLGIVPETGYAESSIQLAPGDSLTFVSDGVVEAQNAAGELFGFDRTAAISTQSAEAIARAAQAHGQEDDITVLTLTFAPAEVDLG
ncbi:MAG: PP2C family protein-serine/threonine phosphatase [Terracidiphilus sp.]